MAEPQLQAKEPNPTTTVPAVVDESGEGVSEKVILDSLLDMSSPNPTVAANEKCPEIMVGEEGPTSRASITTDTSFVKVCADSVGDRSDEVDVSIVVAAEQAQNNASPRQGTASPNVSGLSQESLKYNSVSESSSGSASDHRVVGLDDASRDMEMSQLDSDTTTESSSTSPRDGATSEVPSDDPLTELELLRQGAGSAISNVSSYSWMKEATMGSMMSLDPNSALGRIRADLAEEATKLTNQLVEGPTLTLPPSESVPPKDSVLQMSTKVEETVEQLLKSAASDVEMDKGVAQDQHSAAPDSEKSNNKAPEQEEAPSDSCSQSSDTSKTHFAASPAAPQPDKQPADQPGIAPEAQTDSSRPVAQTTPSAMVEAASSTSSSQPATQPSAASEAPNTSSGTSSSTATSAAAKPRVKRTPNDFIFGKVIGEGSYSTVYLAKEVSTQKEYAIKTCEKKHLIRERKAHFVMREKEVFMKLDHPFFVKLAYTFQDPERLYYVLTYARNGELLGYLNKLSVFDVPCTRFYTAEIVLALEYLHSIGIIHRDLKPENILLSDDMHIKITDFGTSKILQLDKEGKPCSPEGKKKNSFVGTAEYVSPEVLNNQPANFGSDLWALGCIVYQCLSGSMPFRSGNEYQTFQKIVKADYTFPEGFNEDAKDLVSKLLVLEPEQRLGMPGTGGMSALKSHRFYTGIHWADLPSTTPPKLMPYLPATSHNPEFWGQDHRVGFDDQRLAEIITGQSSADGSLSPDLEEVLLRGASSIEGALEERRSVGPATREEKLEKQRRENQFHQFVEGNLILKQGFVDKRKGLFARKRMLLLTEGPHLYYVDAHHKILKGQIPWSQNLRPEAKNFKIFFVHTPNRTYYLESRMPDAQMWVKKIKEVWKRYYGNSQDEDP